MPTNEERRDVAARLRELDTSRLYDGMDEVCALEDACGCDVGQDWQDMELKDRLADLIEPEQERTCALTHRSWDDGMCTWGVECSECGSRFSYETGTCWRYCPSCGAKVVE